MLLSEVAIYQFLDISISDEFFFALNNGIIRSTKTIPLEYRALFPIIGIMSSSHLWLYASSRLRDPTVTDGVFSQWYQEHHVPDVLKTGSVRKGEFFRAIGPQKQFRWLAAYDCDDLDFMEPENFARIPKTHSMLGTTKSCLEFAEFDTRIFQQLFVLKNGEGNETGNTGMCDISTRCPWYFFANIAVLYVRFRPVSPNMYLPL